MSKIALAIGLAGLLLATASTTGSAMPIVQLSKSRSSSLIGAHCEVSPAHDTRPVGPQASGNRAVVPKPSGTNAKWIAEVCG
jgi:hypothetical protein